MTESNQHLSNPLLALGLPRFQTIRAEHALPAVEQRLAEYRELIARIEQMIKARPEAVSYETVVDAETLADDALSNAWSSISHLHSVNATDEWRAAYSSCLEPLTRFSNERGQNRALYQAYRQLADRDDFEAQADELRSTIDHELRSFRLAGVALPDEPRQRFADINVRLSELSNQFGNQVMDATEAYRENFDSADALKGLPDSDLALLANLASLSDEKGWSANLSFPVYRAIITYADDRKLRERFHRAYATRASDQGPQASQFDNSALVDEMMALRAEQAALLEFEHYTAMRLSTRMADSSEQIEGFLTELAERARPLAEQQFTELSEFAKGLGAELPLAAWDVGYYAEKLREQQLGINQEKLKPWFELQHCFDGLFEVAGELFGLRFEVDDAVETWHEDVHFYRVLNAAGEQTAGLYLDLYARERKQGGAWMGICRSKLQLAGQNQQPIAFLTCNFAPPSDGQPSLLTHDDLVTLFHEFGHCLHHLLTRINRPGVGGISGVEWDAVELPSQLLESWAWDAEALNRYARHIETKETLPTDLLDGLLADRQFHGAMALLRQIEFALTDLRLHSGSSNVVLAVMRSVNEAVAVVPMIEENRYIMSFSHLFNGGYSAGYYSYLWAERLARDAFEVFRSTGVFDRTSGQKLAREILEVGASRPMAESWKAFRGQEAALDPLLDAYGVHDKAA
ncbi:MAG: M3 family metallopeptidase [Pseudomonadota bacterium]